jgi:hypothetical protein
VENENGSKLIEIKGIIGSSRHPIDLQITSIQAKCPVSLHIQYTHVDCIIYAISLTAHLIEQLTCLSVKTISPSSN